MKRKVILFGFLMMLFSGLHVSIGQNYVVGPGDILRITVYDNKDLETTARVGDTGSIIMPLIGRVDVADLNILQISDVITEKLADGYIVNPQVTVFIEEYRSKKVVILGQVNRPGLYELSGDINFLELISKAGGLGQNAGNTATIKRKINHSNKVIAIDLAALIEKGDLSQNEKIVDGDTINVAKAGLCFVTGQVKNPGTYACGEKSTVLKLVVLAGGFTGKASRSGVKVVRKEGEESKVYKDVDLDTQVKADDVIIIPESFF